MSFNKFAFEQRYLNTRMNRESLEESFKGENHFTSNFLHVFFVFLEIPIAVLVHRFHCINESWREEFTKPRHEHNRLANQHRRFDCSSKSAANRSSPAKSRERDEATCLTKALEHLRS